MRQDWVEELFVLLAAPSAIDAAVPESWVDDVLAFWFEALEPADWFRKSDATDTAIHDHFLMLYANVTRMPVAAHAASPRQALAAVIVLDQFPRNLFRGTAHSFGTDKLARDVAEAAIATGHDGALSSPHERVFLYLPFEHSENLADQDRSVALISALGNAEYTKYAEAHRDVIRRFGRFPHRNAALRRPSTADEEAYLAEPGSGF